ncbi:MAG: hypothetical protein FWG64_00910 [Firmicutes bacterium]|nr:hypothetical protein [Bacillota bacterium]
MNILFWNTNRKNPENITACLCELLLENAVDLLILAEYPNETQALCETINKISLTAQYKIIPTIKKSAPIKAIIRAKYTINPLQEESRYQLVQISQNANRLIIAMIHGKDKHNNDDLTQLEIISDFRRDIIENENRLKCKHSLAIGDFNVNPFDAASFATSGMHALPFASLLARPTRTVNKKTHQKFYNPTWQLFANKSPPHTSYYFDNSGQAQNLYWYALDQVIVSKGLINHFEDVKIIAKTKNHDLLANGKPNKKIYSDHLPLFCRLKEDFI